jgi:chemotaxis protein methyltransferase CheR
MPGLDPDDLRLLQGLLKRRSGFALTNDKQYLIDARLLPLARREGLSGVAALIAKLRAPQPERLEAAVTEAMLLTDTRFFRDCEPFDSFADTMLPALLRSRDKSQPVRIWCAGAATGQEPLSLAILIAEADGLLSDWSFEITATDLSSAAIARARSGRYSHFEVQTGLTIQRHLDWFSREGEMWLADPRLLAGVSYSTHNLLDDFSALGSFDVVFCRNVLRFMDDDTRAEVAQKLNQVVADDGYVVLGTEEENDLLGLSRQIRASA